MARASLQGVIMQANGAAGGATPVSVATYSQAVKQVSDMFKSILTQTTDTGQVNFATLTTLPGTGVTRDYEIYQLNDSFTATAPVYLRIDYGYTQSTGTPVSFGFSTSGATDGAGNLTGTAAVARQTVSVASTNFYAYLSTDGSQVVFVFNFAPIGSTPDSYSAFVLERYRNLDGTPSGDGYNLWSFVNGSFYYDYSRILGATTQPAVSLTPPAMIPGIANATSFFSGGTEYAFPFTTWGPTWRGASQALMCGMAVDFPRDAVVNITHYGKTAQFLALGSSGGNMGMPYFTAVGAPGTAGARIGISPLFRWE